MIQNVTVWRFERGLFFVSLFWNFSICIVTYGVTWKWEIGMNDRYIKKVQAMFSMVL